MRMSLGTGAQDSVSNGPRSQKKWSVMLGPQKGTQDIRTSDISMDGKPPAQQQLPKGHIDGDSWWWDNAEVGRWQGT